MREENEIKIEGLKQFKKRLMVATSGSEEFQEGVDECLAQVDIQLEQMIAELNGVTDENELALIASKRA